MPKSKRLKYVISACLLGVPCRWNSKGSLNKRALKVFLRGDALAVCPEVMAKLPTPRPACEIKGGSGEDVLKGTAKVVDKNGRDYSAAFIRGAERARKMVEKYGATNALLKSGSPSCGAACIYKGDFSGKHKRGRGVFAATLKKHGVKITELP